ncbi:hypothetical protein XH97_02420 [Bradyrhizobium sp. CCBAU 53380]|nr:hypothetical protein [Bradyrhizobium sp. CCBAU 53380]
MAYAFPKEEYVARLKRVREEMAKSGIDLLIVIDPAHMNYLVGYDAWSYQNTQALLVPANASHEPVWAGRGVDAISAHDTTWLSADNILAYADHYSDSHEHHAMEAIAAFIRERGWDKGRIGYEGDVYYFSPKALKVLEATLSDAEFVDVGLMINWLKTIKMPREVEFMRRAGKIADRVMSVAVDTLRPGIRECDYASRIVQAQLEGTPEFGGSWPNGVPHILTGQRAGIPHAPWTDDVIPRGASTALELGGSYLRYNAGLCRTIYMGTPPQALVRLGSVVQEGLEAALAAVKPGVTCHEVWSAWQRVLGRAGFEKKSRIGYSIGLNYPPSWRDHTASLRSGEEVELKPNMTFHMICGMWSGDGTKSGEANYELSETFLVTDTGVETLTNFERKLFVKP